MKKPLVVLMFLIVLVMPTLVGAAAQENIVTVGKDTEVPAGTTVSGNVVVFGATATIRGRVRESVVVILGNIYLEEEAVVDGNVVAVGGSVIKKATAQIGGENISLGVGDINFAPRLRWPGYRRVGVRSLWTLLSIVFLGWVIFWLFPQPVLKIALAVDHDPLKSVLYGLLAYLAMIPLSIMLLITIIGIPVIPFLWIAMIIGRFFGQVALGLLAGRFLAQKLNQSWLDAAQVVAGLLGLGILTFIPVLGGLVSLFYGLLGFGAVIWTRFGREPVIKGE